MPEPHSTSPNPELEDQLQTIYRSAPPDPGFTRRLEQKLVSRLQNPPISSPGFWSRLLARVKPGLPAVAWGTAIVLFALVLVWSINHLISRPGAVPAAISPADPTESTSHPIREAGALNGTRWALVSLQDRDLLENVQITLDFYEDRAKGTTGCNDYGWWYAAPEDETQDVLIEITAQGCIEPAGIMDQEQAYIDTLQQAAAYRQTDDRLELFNSTGETLLVFIPLQEEPQPAGEFAIYLLVGNLTVSDVFESGRQLDSLILRDEPILSTGDIVSYNPDTYEMEVTPEAAQRLESLRVPVSGMPFVVTVGEERIYAGAFWTLLSSLYFDKGVVVNVHPASVSRVLRFQMHYPESPESFRGEDLRADPRILDALTAAGKVP